MASVGEIGERQDTKRLEPKKQTLDDAYAAPANFLEIDVVNPETHGIGKKRYTDYEVRMRVGRDNLHFVCIHWLAGCIPLLVRHETFQD